MMPVPAALILPSLSCLSCRAADDLLVAIQGDECDVTPSSEPPEQSRVGTDVLSGLDHASGAAVEVLACLSGPTTSPGCPVSRTASYISGCAGGGRVAVGHNNHTTRPESQDQEN